MTQTANSPDRILYAVREYQVEEDSKADWTKVGVGWSHKDGKGVSLKVTLPIDLISLEGHGFRLVLRDVSVREDSSTASSTTAVD